MPPEKFVQLWKEEIEPTLRGIFLINKGKIFPSNTSTTNLRKEKFGEHAEIVAYIPLYHPLRIHSGSVQGT